MQSIDFSKSVRSHNFFEQNWPAQQISTGYLSVGDMNVFGFFFVWLVIFRKIWLLLIALNDGLLIFCDLSLVSSVMFLWKIYLSLLTHVRLQRLTKRRNQNSINWTISIVLILFFSLFKNIYCPFTIGLKVSWCLYPFNISISAHTYRDIQIHTNTYRYVLLSFLIWHMLG